MFTQKDLKEWLDYDKDTGIFRWKVRRSYTTEVGQIAGWLGPKGSWRIEVARKNYLAHRLAWFYVYGNWPNQIDHINGNRLDNRICNLRDANNSQNQANAKAKRNNRLGIRGISFNGKRYIVQLKKDGEHFRGRFNTLEEAKSFAKTISMKIHGEFSIHNRIETT